METIQPWKIVMKKHIYYFKDPDGPVCPNCLNRVIVGLSFSDGSHSVCVLCPSCRLQGPAVHLDEFPGDAPGPRRLEAQLRWNRMIERMYHLAHGTIPAQHKKED